MVIRKKKLSEPPKPEDHCIMTESSDRAEKDVKIVVSARRFMRNGTSVKNDSN